MCRSRDRSNRNCTGINGRDVRQTKIQIQVSISCSEPFQPDGILAPCFRQATATANLCLIQVVLVTGLNTWEGTSPRLRITWEHFDVDIRVPQAGAARGTYYEVASCVEVASRYRRRPHSADRGLPRSRSGSAAYPARAGAETSAAIRATRRNICRLRQRVIARSILLRAPQKPSARATPPKAEKRRADESARFKTTSGVHGPALSTPNADAVTALLAAMRRAADEIDYVVGESIARQIAELRRQGI